MEVGERRGYPQPGSAGSDLPAGRVTPRRAAGLPARFSPLPLVPGHLGSRRLPLVGPKLG